MSQLFDDAPFDLDEPSTKAPVRQKENPKATALKIAQEKREEKQDDADEVDENAAEILKLVQSAPVEVLMSDEKRDELFSHIKSEIAAFKPDLTTGAGRKRVAKLAYKITRTKTAIDDAGKEANRVLREKIDAVDARRRDFRSTLDELAAEARDPLTKWEEEEERRQKVRDTYFERVASLARYPQGATSADIEERIHAVSDLECIVDDFGQEEHAKALEKRKEALDSLAAAFVMAKDNERQAAELARLKAEADRQAAELAAMKRAAIDEEQRKAAALEAEKRREADEKSRADEEAARREKAEQQATAAANLSRILDNAVKQLGELHTPATDIVDLEDLAGRMKGLIINEELHGSAYIDLTDRRDYVLESAVRRVMDFRETNALAEDKERRKKRNTEIRDAIQKAGGITKEQAQEIAKAIIGGHVPHLEVK